MACVGPGIAPTLLEACVTRASHQEVEEGNNSNVGTWPTRHHTDTGDQLAICPSGLLQVSPTVS